MGKLRFSGNLQCPKALLQFCGNRSLPQCCGNALRHCGLLQCAQRIAAMAPLWQYCSDTTLQQYCGNAAAIAVLQQHCGNAHCKVLLQYCGNAFWHCRNTPIFSRCTNLSKDLKNSFWGNIRADRLLERPELKCCIVAIVKQSNAMKYCGDLSLQSTMATCEI